MDLKNLVISLRNFSQLLTAQVAGVSAADARWKPPSMDWSILEIVCHLVDEEQDDFPLRLRMTLENEGGIRPSINPELTAVDRKYNEQDLNQKVNEFCHLRAASLDWLEGLRTPDWQASYAHPHLGTLQAGDIFAAWAAHDQLHVRQIAKRKYEMIRRDAGNFSVDYAGGWTN